VEQKITKRFVCWLLFDIRILKTKVVSEGMSIVCILVITESCKAQFNTLLTQLFAVDTLVTLLFSSTLT
jgi:hypothetical protein